MRALILFILIIIDTTEGRITLFYTEDPIQRIGPRLYKKELLTDQYKDPKELAYDSSTRNLFFMHLDEALQNSGRAYINVVTRIGRKIEGIKENKATAVDCDTNTVYFGSRDGLYIYDSNSNRARNVGLYNVNVYKLVVRDGQMYLIDANDHMIYTVVNGSKVRRFGNVKTVIDFEIDGRGNVYFVTMCGVYCAVGGGEIVKNELNFAYNFIVDGEKTYAVSDGLYQIECETGGAVKISDLDFNPRSLVFGDYGEIYYSEDDSIYRLTPVSSYLEYNLSM